MISFKPNTLFIQRSVQKLINKGSFTFSANFHDLGGEPSDNAALNTYLNNLNQSIYDRLNNNKEILFRGRHHIGDTNAVSEEIPIDFGIDIGTDQYIIAGSFVSLSADFNIDNNVIWMVREHTGTGFKFMIREVAQSVKDLAFDYVIVKA